MKRSLLAICALAATYSAMAQTNQRLSPAGEPPLQLRQGRARLIGRFNAQQKLRLAVGLQRPRVDEEEQFLQELMTPGSPNFHKFLTPAEWTARFSPSVEDEQAVVDWATSEGLVVTHRYPNRLIVDVEAPVATIERALRVTIDSYQLESYSYFSNAREPAIPANLASIVHSVGGLTNFPEMFPASFHGTMEPGPVYRPGPVVAPGNTVHADGNGARGRQGPVGQLRPNFTNNLIDPTDIYSSNAYDYAALQNVGFCCNPNHDAGGAPKESSIALATFGNLHTGVNPTPLPDVDAFQAQYPYLALNVKTVIIDGGPGTCTVTVTPKQQCLNDLETALDTEWATATSNSFGSFLDTAQVWVYEDGGSPEDMYNQMVTDDHARIFSTSWDCSENGSCISSSIMDTRHGIFNNMVGLGWTLMNSSGDTGATADCATISVNYPASDPDVIGVGGTSNILFNNTTYNNEVAWTGSTAAKSCSTNGGGSGGGCSVHFSTPAFQSGSNGSCGTKRGLPDIALNANETQNMYFNGSLVGVTGTSISSPMLAGFFAQEGAYLLHLKNVTGNSCGAHGPGGTGGPCGPMGNGNPYLYYLGQNPNYAPHYPFYDITSGCNSNDITVANKLTAFCAGTGYDNVTGWGSANMLQLAWAINSIIGGDFAAPNVNFSGPIIGQWNRTNQTVSWTVNDISGNGAVPIGVAGYSKNWDGDVGDDSFKATPGTGSSFYSGPQVVGASSTSGSLLLNNSLEGCHTAHVRAWDNGGSTADRTYGPVCFDDIPPSISCGSPDGLWHPANIAFGCTASDSLSGLANPADASFTLITSVPAGTETAFAATNSHVVADVAGNTRTAGPIGPNKIDRKPPVVLCGVPDGLWHANNVTLPCTASDGGSGLANPADASFGLTTSVPAGTETATAATNSYAVFDAVLNFTVAGPISPNMIDRKPPVITIVQPMVALYSHSTSLILNYTVTDGGSGVGTVTATMNGASTVGGKALTNGQVISFLTLPLGMNTFTVNATDNVGNSSSSSVTFTIIATFQDTLNDIDSLLAMFLIDNSTTANKLKAEIMAAQAATGFDRINLLNQFLNDLAALAGKSIFGKAEQILQDDANSLWSFQTPALRPIPNAGPNQTVAKGSTVQLDGSQSTNPSLTIPVSYSWSFTSRPAGSVAVLASPNTVNPTFVPDKAGTYVVTLMYSNPTDVSFASVTITAN